MKKEKIEKIRQILALNIKKRRESMGISQEVLAESAGLSIQTINTIEGCRMWVSDNTITRIAKALNVEVFQLLVPCYAEKQYLNMPLSPVLLEAKKKILNDLNSLNANIDFIYNQAIKNNTHELSDVKTSFQKRGRAKPRRIVR